ncbi:endonuclease domain-containing protein [Methylobacterium komagatae]
MSKLGGFELLAQEAADEAYRDVMYLRDEPFGDTPIEALFFASLVTVAGNSGRCINTIFKHFGKNDLEYTWEIAAMGNPLNEVAVVERQIEIAGWRVDFLIHYHRYVGPNKIRDRLIVECDGHKYHERTKQQAARDRSRDRTAQHEGIAVFRFTGSELWNDPVGCGNEVLDFMERTV